MKLYLISQTENDGYDTYSDCVVAAEDEEDARSIHPGDDPSQNYYPKWETLYGTWASSPGNVQVKLLGQAEPDQERGVILASFHAG